MKKIIAFISMLFTAFIGFFKSKKPVPIVEEKPFVAPKMIVPPTIKSIGRRNYSQHNNRRNTKGRFVQFVEFDGKTKPIYHGAK
jgi:hypothetical protein